MRQDSWTRCKHPSITVRCPAAKPQRPSETLIMHAGVRAGEHTCKEHPDTVGGAMLTGVREAVRAFHALHGEDAFGRAAAAQVDRDAVRKRRKVGRPRTLPAQSRRHQHAAFTASFACIPHRCLKVACALPTPPHHPNAPLEGFQSLAVGSGDIHLY